MSDIVNLSGRGKIAFILAAIASKVGSEKADNED